MREFIAGELGLVCWEVLLSIERRAAAPIVLSAPFLIAHDAGAREN